MKIVINRCYGGFGLSDFAYEELIKLGIPVKKYIQQERGENGLYKDEPENSGEIIFDRTLSKGEGIFNDEKAIEFMGRYWETWIDGNRNHPLLIKVVEKLGEKASGRCAKLKIIEIPDDVKYTIEEYDGMEHVAEQHRTWY